MKNTLIYEKYIDWLCTKYIKKNDKIFDCGCGDGMHTFILKQYSKYVIGGDFDNRSKNEYGINFRKIDVNKYGKENEFDVVTSFDVIEHVADGRSYLEELIRITKSGRYLIIGTPNKNRLSNKIISLFRGKIKYPRNLGYHWESGGDIIHVREYTIKDLEKLALSFNNINIIEIKHGFLGVYTSIGPIGLKDIDKNILRKYCQHLFIIIQKK